MGVLRLLRMKCALKEPNRAFSQLGRLRSPRPLQCSAMMVGAFWSLCVACHQVSALAQFCFHRFACSSCEAGHEKATPESHITQSVMSLQSCLETMAFGLKTPQKYNRSLYEDMLNVSWLTPYVDFIGVVWAAKNQFRRSIVAADDIRGVQPLWRHYFRRTEVANLDNALFIAENVLGLEITMANALLVHVGHPS